MYHVFLVEWYVIFALVGSAVSAFVSWDHITWFMFNNTLKLPLDHATATSKSEILGDHSNK